MIKTSDRKAHISHLLAILSCLAVSGALSLDKLSASLVKGSIHVLLLAILIYAILRCLSFFKPLQFIVALFIGIELFVQLTYQSSLSISIVMSVINAPLGESASFASTYLVEALLAVLLVLFMGTAQFTGGRLVGFTTASVGFAYLLIPLLIQMPGVYKNAFYEDYLNKGTSRGNSKTFSTIEYTFHKLSLRFPPFESLIAIVDSVKLLTMQVNSETSWTGVNVSKQAPDLLVIGIGESLRAGNMGIYGYDRETTPKLNALQSSLTVFDQVYAAGSNTWSSIPAILTKTKSLPDLSKSIIHLANDAGYETYWLSNQAEFGQWDFSITSLANQAQTTYFTSQDEGGSQLDEALYSQLEKAINLNTNKKLIILHFYGSHMNFEDRYSEEFSVFDSGAPDLDHYDNSVLYTDYLQEQFIQLVQSKGGEYMFFSDHGLGKPNGEMSLKHDVRIPPNLDSLQVPLLMTGSLESLANQEIVIDSNRPFSLFYFECLFSAWSGISANELEREEYCANSLSNQDMIYLDANMSLRKEQAPKQAKEQSALDTVLASDG